MRVLLPFDQGRGSKVLTQASIDALACLTALSGGSFKAGIDADSEADHESRSPAGEKRVSKTWLPKLGSFW